MPVSDLLEIPVLSEAMAQKTIGVNMAIQAIEKAISAKLDIATTAAVSAGFDLVIPFATTNDFSGREALRAVFYNLVAGATQSFDLIHPDNPHLFIIKNNTAHIATVRTVTGGAAVAVPSSATFLIICDGLNMTKMDFSVTSLVQAYDIDFSFYGAPAVSQLLGQVILARNVTFPANFAGFVGNCTTFPTTASYTMTVWDDSTQIGTISISSGGVFSATTTSGTEKVVLAGSLLQLRAPALLDATLDTFAVALPGVTTVSQPVA